MQQWAGRVRSGKVCTAETKPSNSLMHLLNRNRHPQFLKKLYTPSMLVLLLNLCNDYEQLDCSIANIEGIADYLLLMVSPTPALISATVLPKSVTLWVSVQTLCLHFYGPFLRDRKHWLCTLTEQREDSTISRGVDKLWQDWHTDI